METGTIVSDVKDVRCLDSDFVSQNVAKCFAEGSFCDPSGERCVTILVEPVFKPTWMDYAIHWTIPWGFLGVALLLAGLYVLWPANKAKV